MKIHGLRIYPQSVARVRGGAPIFLHGRVSEAFTDFFYIFRLLAPLWRGHVFAQDFGVSLNEKMEFNDPMPGLRRQFGSSLIETDLDSQLMLLQGDDFVSWGASMHFCEGAFLPIFRTRPTFDLPKKLYWDRKFRLTSETWPAEMRAVVHMWDGAYWQLFTTVRSDLDLLIQAHAEDPRLKLYSVDFDREYPDPSNEELQPAAL